MDKLIWKEIPSSCRKFITQFEDEVIHVIKTGFDDEYMVVWEDAHEMKLGNVNFFMTKEQVENTFNIKLDDTGVSDFHPMNEDCSGFSITLANGHEQWIQL